MERLQRTSQRAFIFEGDWKRLLASKTTQERQGNLFGLWTSEGDPVIHIITESDCCPKSKHSRFSLADFPDNRFPLVHIGNWRYVGPSSAHVEDESTTLASDYSRSCQNTEDYFLNMIITESDITLEYRRNFKMKILFLPNESPFRRLAAMEKITIKGHDENTDYELKESFVKEDYPTRPRHHQIEDSDADDLEDTLETSIAKGERKAFIFRKDYESLRLNATHGERQGNLFGLWTTNGEPVIHVICRPNCCPNKYDYSRLGVDIFSNDFPLTHIGNWLYTDVSFSHALPMKSRGLDSSWCPHQSKATGKFLDVVILKSAILVLQDGREREIELLDGRSPFRDMEGFKRIAIKDQYDDFTTELEEPMKHLSVTSKRISPHQRKEMSSSPDFEDPPTYRDSISSRDGWQEGPMYLGTPGFQRDFTSNSDDFKVFIFEEDLQMMAKLVLKYPHLETGGDLFGLWTTAGDVVLHIVLGPGQNCKRTGASFYQDISYLKRNGELLTQDYMLCHIGEWHSHHQLQLFQPSGGDSSTVIRNYPRGVCGFILIIANILSSREVQLSPYLYTQGSSYSFDKKGKLVRLPAQRNAFKTIRRIRDSIERGKEIQTHSPSFYRDEEDVRNAYDPRRHPTQTGKTMQKMSQARDPMTYTRQNRNYKQLHRLQTRTPTGQLSTPPRRISSSSRLCCFPSNRHKTARYNNRPDNRPPWRH